MTEIPKFFVPESEGQNESEETYQGIARDVLDFVGHIQLSVPELSERYYSVTWKHNKETWTATVGERLKGERYIDESLRKENLSDQATILAIYPYGDAFIVVTTKQYVSDVNSEWNGIITTERPIKIVKFKTE